MKSLNFTRNIFSILVLVFTFLLVERVEGQVVVFGNTWTGSPVSVNATYNDLNVQAVTLSRSTGISATSSSVGFRASGFASSTTLNLSNNDFFTFTINAVAGATFNLNSSSLSISLSSSSTGPQSFGIYTSVGGFSSTSSQIGANLSATSNQQISFPSTGYSNLTNIEIRIYGWNASAAGGTGGPSFIQLSGTTIGQVLPEPTNQATALTLGAVTTSTLPLSWTAAAAGSQAPDGYLVLVNSGNITDPVDGTDPGAGSTVMNLGSASFKTSGTSASFSAADAGTMYNMKIYSFTNGGSNINFNSTSPTTGNFATKPNPISGLNSLAIGTSQINLNWLSPFNYNVANHTTLVFVKSGSAIGFVNPTNAPSLYTANSIFGNGTSYQEDNAATCVYKGDGTSATIYGLNASTTYHFLILVVVDASNSNNFNSYSSSILGNTTTENIPAPIASSASNIGCETFTANWSAVTGATSYFLDVFPSSDVASDLIFSEYVEGNSNNKYVEIYNGTISTIDLSNYQLQTYANGSSINPTSTNLTGFLAPGATVVYQNSSASAYSGTAINNSSMNFNGDDAIALYKLSTSAFVDIIGSIGEDPGDGWTSGSFSTLNKSLVRKANVKNGVSVNPSSGFPTLSTEWNVFNIDDVSNLGSHTYTINFVSGYQNLGVNGTNQNITGLTPGGTFVYRVRSSNSQVTSSNSNHVLASLTSTATWLGGSTGDWNTASNWCGGVPVSGANVTIPVNTTVTVDGNSEVIIGNLTINGTLILPNNAKVTVNGQLSNNGTLTLENKATIVQGASSTYAGSGTVQVKQTITGGNNGNSPNGRFWYLGSPVSGGLSSILDAAGANIVKYWDEQSAAWIEITDNTSALTVGRGHYLRSNTPGNHDLTFTGGTLNNGAYTFNLTANGSSFNGFNLVSNPYASYLKWNDVTKTNVGSTIWYRTSNGANNMVFDTYNSNGNVGTSNNGNGTVSQFIPPMQAFWVRVEGSTTGSITMDNLDRSHHISGMQGMHSMDSKLMFANLSLEKDSLRDQAIVYCSYQTTDAQDAFDSEKMIQAGTPQLYSKIGDKKMVINAKNFMQRNEATPLYMNINNAGTHTIKLGEFNSTFGSIWLEDNTTQQFQNLLINDTYTFESQAGQDIARFVLHFGYPNQIYGSTETTDQPNNNPDEVINWADVSVGTSGSKVIELTANLNETEALQTKTMAIFDMTGRQVLTQSFESGNTQVYIPNANGVYLVQVQIGNTQKVFKVLIQE
jgi:hypothetical protein